MSSDRSTVPKALAAIRQARSGVGTAFVHLFSGSAQIGKNARCPTWWPGEAHAHQRNRHSDDLDSSMTNVGPSQRIPAEIADYRLLAPLGDGGALFVAGVPPRLGLDVDQLVVKVVPGGDDAAFRRFVRELKLFSRVQSPNLITLYDAGQYENWFFSSMEHCSLGSLLESAATLDTTEKLEAVRSAALAAHDLHEAGIAHRDIRPSKVLHRADGSWCLSDLDHAFLGGGSITSMAPIGAIGFLDPGTLLGESAGRASDIYSLGATLHWALTGHYVHPAVEGADAMLAVRAVLRNPPHIRREDLSAESADLIAACVASDATQRPPTALVVADLIGDLLTAAAKPAGATPEPPA
jgi:serine/threonine protein kinase